MPPEASARRARPAVVIDLLQHLASNVEGAPAALIAAARVADVWVAEDMVAALEALERAEAPRVQRVSGTASR